MITEDERFIKIQGILAFSDIHPTDCNKINDLIIELSKERNKYRFIIEELKKWCIEIQQEEFDINGFTGVCTEMRIDCILDKIKELEEGNSNE